MNDNILAQSEDSQLENEFAAACADPHGLDCGFVEQRRDADFANFGFPPDRAAEMREKELARIAAELENEPIDYYDPDEDEDEEYYDDEDWDDSPLDDDCDEDEDDYDRYEESYGFDEDEDDEDNWE